MIEMMISTMMVMINDNNHDDDDGDVAVNDCGNIFIGVKDDNNTNAYVMLKWY